MKRILILFTIGICSSAAFSQAPAASSNNAKEVFATIVKWADAVRDRDMKVLGELFADDLIVTSHDGKTRGKKEELEVLRPDPNVKTLSVANDDIGVRVFGEVAVVTALTRMQFVIGGKEVPVAMRYTAVFVKKDGRWQIVALQTARAPQNATSQSTK